MKRRRTSKGGMSQAEKNPKNRANRLAANLDDNLEPNVSRKFSKLKNNQNMKRFKGNNRKPLPSTIRIYNPNESMGNYTNTHLK